MYKVLIPAAGTGSRLGGITKYLNKSLVSIANKPALSRIIEMFPNETEFVIATGYKGELIKEFISLAYPDRKVDFVDILLYEGEGSGLGLSIQKCKHLLQQPFVFCSCDTIVTEQIPEPTYNWMGWDTRDELSQYRTIDIENDGGISAINEKGITTSHSKPYIGLSAIYDYEEFWSYMEIGGDAAIVQGESYAFKELLANGFKIQNAKFTWFDIGVEVELSATRERFESSGDPNILPKEEEAIWILEDMVIKFHNDPQFISDRVKRTKILGEYVPHIIDHTTHMYSYEFAKGDVLSKLVSIPIFKEFLNYSGQFWQQRELNGDELEKFRQACMSFYRTKTLDRINLFYEKFGKKDEETYINGVNYPKLSKILDSVDWDWIVDGVPSRYHGDYHFENIVYDCETQQFKMLDWRQNFGKLTDVGDIYYDLSKLLHGLIVSHELIATDSFDVKWEDNYIEFDLHRKQKLVECENYYYKWLSYNGYDVRKVSVLTALIFLNIAPLHHYPYVLLLYALGKKMLFEQLQFEG